MRTARFKELVARCGHPEIHLSWSLPTKDRVLQRAVAQKRLLTVHQEGRGSKKDYAVVGLHPGKFVQYLVFPKSLHRFADRKIVGIDYGLFGQKLSMGLPQVIERRVRSAAVARPERKRAADANIVRFEAPAPENGRPSPTKAARPAQTQPLLLKPWFEEVAAAINEMKGGKHRTALRRLEALLSRNGLKT
jgi:hypothetical protein